MLAKQNKPIYTESVTIKLQLIFHYEERKDLEEPGLKEMKIMTRGQSQSSVCIKTGLNPDPPSNLQSRKTILSSPKICQPKWSQVHILCSSLL